MDSAPGSWPTFILCTEGLVGTSTQGKRAEDSREQDSDVPQGADSLAVNRQQKVTTQTHSELSWMPQREMQGVSAKEGLQSTRPGSGSVPPDAGKKGCPRQHILKQ